MHAKVFSIQMLQYFSQIEPRVCTLVLFICSGGAAVHTDSIFFRSFSSPLLHFSRRPPPPPLLPPPLPPAAPNVSVSNVSVTVASGSGFQVNISWLPLPDHQWNGKPYGYYVSVLTMQCTAP